jgi:hypothetical protein
MAAGPMAESERSLLPAEFVKVRSRLLVTGDESPGPGATSPPVRTRPGVRGLCRLPFSFRE